MKQAFRNLIGFFVFLIAGLSCASAYTLSGTVYGGSTPMVGATVTLTDATTAVQVGQIVSDANGRYTFTVGTGTFNLVVTPTDTARYKESKINSIQVSAAATPILGP